MPQPKKTSMKVPITSAAIFWAVVEVSAMFGMLVAGIRRVRARELAEIS